MEAITHTQREFVMPVVREVLVVRRPSAEPPQAKSARRRIAAPPPRHRGPRD